MSRALLVIDFQKGLATGAHREHEVAATINQIADTMRSQGEKVIYIHHCHDSYEQLTKGHPFWELHPELTPDPDDPRLEKTASDAFYKTDLDTILQEQAVDHLVVTGLQTEYCVDTTCRSALSHGYGVTLIGDAHSTGDSFQSAAEIIAYHNNILPNVAHPDGAIKVMASEEFLAEP